jgi:hypothetical protein
VTPDSKGRPSFLKKRSKKPLSIGARASRKARANRQKFFGSFFKKELLRRCLQQ